MTTSAGADHTEALEFEGSEEQGPRKWRRDWSSAVMRDDRMGAATWVTALVLAERAWHGQRTFHASRRTLAKITGRSERVEREHLDTLAATGWIVDTGMKKNRATVWRLAWPADYREHRGQRSGRTIRPIRPAEAADVSAASSARYVSAASPKAQDSRDAMGGSSARFSSKQSSLMHQGTDANATTPSGGVETAGVNEKSAASRAQLAIAADNGEYASTADDESTEPDNDVCPVEVDEPGWNRFTDCTCKRGGRHADWWNVQASA
ncbi:hypothetical protein [Amycolatopsis orientalis]|uniref:hypothetical protein n=1 Tax=Amycolatopsis orientalis TaxID=31958 RepID=UPI001319EF65|nr:hypothetical protein [Amycolatopsis orientalis]